MIYVDRDIDIYTTNILGMILRMIDGGIDAHGVCTYDRYRSVYSRYDIYIGCMT